ncbi:MAG: hypothetical protein D6752_06480 [Candidatus Nitrosothermus koennekii]|nr:MAG: hypothetical protein D6752_06480 [Candidatus Nitrosothermus koennekii]
MSFIARNKKGLGLGAAIVIGAAIMGILQSPLVKPEVTENAVVLKLHDDGSCEVETEFSNVLTIWDCKGHQKGDQVVVQYKQSTKIGTIISSNGS